MSFQSQCDRETLLHLRFIADNPNCSRIAVVPYLWPFELSSYKMSGFVRGTYKSGYRLTRKGSAKLSQLESKGTEQ